MIHFVRCYKIEKNKFLVLYLKTFVGVYMKRSSQWIDKKCTDSFYKAN